MVPERSTPEPQLLNLLMAALARRAHQGLPPRSVPPGTLPTGARAPGAKTRELSSSTVVSSVLAEAAARRGEVLAEFPWDAEAALVLTHAPGVLAWSVRVWALWAGAPATFGRVRENALVCDEASVSRHHAQFVEAQGRWWVQDLNSTNGTRLNGQRCERSPLVAHDRLALGGVHVLFLCGPTLRADLTASLATE